MRRLAATLAGLGFFWALAATVHLLRGAGYDAVTTSSASGGGPEGLAHVAAPLLSERGPWVVLLLVGVTLLAGIPLGVALRHPDGLRTTTSSVGLVLLVFSLIAGFSVGLAYLPASIALLAAAVTIPVDSRPVPPAP